MIDAGAAATRSVAAICSVFIFGGCNGVTVPERDPIQEGVIVERGRRTPTSDDRPTIWVKDDPSDECGVVYSISGESELWTRDPLGRTRRIGVERLEVDARVRVWASGILLSCPGQASAEAVEIVSGEGEG